MIVKCKICDGKGKISGEILDFSGKICPACKGVINIHKGVKSLFDT